MRVDPLILLAEDARIAAAALEEATRAIDLADRLPDYAKATIALRLRQASNRALVAAHRLQPAKPRS